MNRNRAHGKTNDKAHGAAEIRSLHSPNRTANLGGAAARTTLALGLAQVTIWATVATADAAPPHQGKAKVREPVATQRPTIAVSVKTASGACEFLTAVNARPTLQCRAGNKVMWRYQQDQERVSENGLFVTDGLLLAVRYAIGGSGAVIDAYDLTTGEKRWRNYTIGVGPVVHSAYENVIRARVESMMSRHASDSSAASVPGRLIIEGTETGGRYIEFFHTADGQRFRLARHIDTAPTGKVPALQEVALTDEQKQLPATPALTAPALGGAATLLWGPVADPPNVLNPNQRDNAEARSSTGLRCVVAYNNGSQALRCYDVYDKLAWQIETRPTTGVDVSIAASDSVLVVCRYHPLASGARATGYDIRTGRELWTNTLHGVGPVAHSKWSNRLAVRAETLDKRAAFVVSGEELTGKYLEVIDEATGRTVGYQKR